MACTQTRGCKGGRGEAQLVESVFFVRGQHGHDVALSSQGDLFVWIKLTTEVTRAFTDQFHHKMKYCI